MDQRSGWDLEAGPKGCQPGSGPSLVPHIWDSPAWPPTYHPPDCWTAGGVLLSPPGTVPYTHPQQTLHPPTHNPPAPRGTPGTRSSPHSRWDEHIHTTNLQTWYTVTSCDASDEDYRSEKSKFIRCKHHLLAVMKSNKNGTCLPLNKKSIHIKSQRSWTFHKLYTFDRYIFNRLF